MTITLPRLRFLAPLFAASVFCASALGGYFSSGSAGALIACFLLFLLTAAVRPTRREWGMGAIPAALFAFFRTVGYSYDTTDSSDLLLKNAQTMLRGAAAMAALFAAALCAVVLLFRLLDALRAHAQAGAPATQKEKRRLFWLCAGLIFAGSIPYLLRDINVPIYATRMSAGLIQLKLEEHQLVKSTKLITVEPGKTVRAGKFQVEFIHVNHSIADSVAFAIHTHMGTIVHTGDFKIDSTPIDGEVIDLARFGALGKEGVLALLADSTNVERPGYTMSERTVGKTFIRQFTGCKKRIIVTTFASNVHRIQQVLDAAAACGRKVAVTGRSMENIMKVSTELGYMKVPKNTLVDINRIKGLPLNQQVIVTTGSQGEEMSALYRMAFSTHKQVDIGPGDKVIISASAIPGNEVTVGRVINELFRKGADVVYDKADMLHVSGHACQEELKIIHALTKPRFFIPLHGEQRMLQIHKRVAESMGMAPTSIVVADNGSVIELTTKHIKCETTVPAGEVFVDGGGVGEVGAVVLNDRKLLAEDGMVVIVLPMSSHDHQLLCPPEIVTRGFVYVKESEELLESLRRVATETVDGMSARKRRDEGDVCRAVRSAVSSYLYKHTKRSPMIIPMVTKL